LKKQIKKRRFEKKRTKFDTKISNHKGWNWKTISIKKMIKTTKNNNQKNEYHIWYKIKMLREKTQR
jgi:hypothetical protein